MSGFSRTAWKNDKGFGDKIMTVDMDIDFLKRALDIEERAYKNAKTAYEFHRDDENRGMVDALKEIMDDEENHVLLIKEMIKKKQK